MERQHVIDVIDSHFRELRTERPSEITPRMVVNNLIDACKSRVDSNSEEFDKIMEADSIIQTWTHLHGRMAEEFASKLMSEVYISLLQKAESKDEIKNLAEELESITRNLQQI